MRGFTLIEAMIVMAIIGLIAAITFPSYQNQIRDGRRADCTAVLMQARQNMERFYSKNYTYVGATVADIPAKCPIDGSAQYYALTLPTATATAFTVLATVQGDQANDGCGNLSINQAGVKTYASGSIDTCWR